MRLQNRNIWSNFHIESASRIEVCHEAADIKFHVKDKDHAYSEYIGEVSISVRALLETGIVEGEFPITDNSSKDRGRLVVRVQFIMTSDVEPSFDIESYFHMKTNNRVTLYQDACCPDVSLRMPQFMTMELPEHASAGIIFVHTFFVQEAKRSTTLISLTLSPTV